MRPEAAARIALAVLVVGLVGIGLAVTGGPGKGRVERRDQTRLWDLNQLRDYVFCIAESRGNVLPDTLEPVEICRRDIRLSDPFTGAPYRYEKVSPTSFRLCAVFEDPDWVTDNLGASLDRDTGCLHFAHPD